MRQFISTSAATALAAVSFAIALVFHAPAASADDVQDCKTMCNLTANYKSDEDLQFNCWSGCDDASIAFSLDFSNPWDHLAKECKRSPFGHQKPAELDACRRGAEYYVNLKNR